MQSSCESCVCVYDLVSVGRGGAPTIDAAGRLAVGCAEAVAAGGRGNGVWGYHVCSSRQATESWVKNKLGKPAGLPVGPICGADGVRGLLDILALIGTLTGEDEGSRDNVEADDVKPASLPRALATAIGGHGWTEAGTRHGGTQVVFLVASWEVIAAALGESLMISLIERINEMGAKLVVTLTGPPQRKLNGDPNEELKKYCPTAVLTSLLHLSGTIAPINVRMRGLVGCSTRRMKHDPPEVTIRTMQLSLKGNLMGSMRSLGENSQPFIENWSIRATIASSDVGRLAGEPSFWYSSRMEGCVSSLLLYLAASRRGAVLHRVDTDCVCILEAISSTTATLREFPKPYLDYFAIEERKKEKSSEDLKSNGSVGKKRKSSGDRLDDFVRRKQRLNAVTFDSLHQLMLPPSASKALNEKMEIQSKKAKTRLTGISDLARIRRVRKLLHREAGSVAKGLYPSICEVWETVGKKGIHDKMGMENFAHDQRTFSELSMGFIGDLDVALDLEQNVSKGENKISELNLAVADMEERYRLRSQAVEPNAPGTDVLDDLRGGGGAATTNATSIERRSETFDTYVRNWYENLLAHEDDLELNAVASMTREFVCDSLGQEELHVFEGIRDVLGVIKKEVVTPAPTLQLKYRSAGEAGATYQRWQKLREFTMQIVLRLQLPASTIADIHIKKEGLIKSATQGNAHELSKANQTFKDPLAKQERRELSTLIGALAFDLKDAGGDLRSYCEDVLCGLFSATLPKTVTKVMQKLGLRQPQVLNLSQPEVKDQEPKPPVPKKVLEEQKAGGDANEAAEPKGAAALLSSQPSQLEVPSASFRRDYAPHFTRGASNLRRNVKRKVKRTSANSVRGTHASSQPSVTCTGTDQAEESNEHENECIEATPLRAGVPIRDIVHETPACVVSKNKLALDRKAHRILFASGNLPNA